MNSSKNINKKLGISKKFMINIAVLCVVLCASSCIAGYIQYNNTITKLYNENAYSIGDMIVSELDAEKIAEYTRTWKEDDYYKHMKVYLDNSLVVTNAEYIYIAVPNEDGTIKYVYDSSGMVIGSKDKVTKYLDEALSIYKTGENPRTNYFVRTSDKYGSITCSIVPIFDSTNKPVALLFVDLPMELINSTLFGYIVKAVVISIILMLIALMLGYFRIKNSVIKPIQILESCLNDFASNNAEITTELKNINTNDELENLASSIYSMENDIVNYIDKITNITAERERISAELNLATQIQESILPSVFPAFPERKEFDIYASMSPAKEIGGDFYDFFLIDHNHIAVVMADVSGKGIPAALFMMISKALIKNAAKIDTNDLSPARILEKVNNQLCENNKIEMFVTVWLGILDIRTGIITAANAGHEYPAIMHNGKFELIKDKHGFVVAGMENIKFKDYEIKLEKGDYLFIYTDGVAEATNLNNELFGTDRMLEALNLNSKANCNEIIDNVQNSICSFVANAPQFDDITMLCLQYLGDDLMKEITVPATTDNLNDVMIFIDNYLDSFDCPIKTKMQIDIAVDEIFSNVSSYAYQGSSGNITITIDKYIDNNTIELSFIDSGKKYNPLEKEDPDVTLSAEERNIGGLGIFIVKKNMDDVKYEYRDGKNILTIVKNF